MTRALKTRRQINREAENNRHEEQPRRSSSKKEDKKPKGKEFVEDEVIDFN